VGVSLRSYDAVPGLPEPVQLPVIDLPEGGDVFLPLARQQVLTRALLTAIRSVGQPQGWQLAG
jgi:hypothetical protein